MQASSAVTGDTSFPLSQAIFAIAAGEPAAQNTALNLCLEAGSILQLVVAQLSSTQISLTLQTDIIKSIRAAASLIEAANTLNESESESEFEEN